MSLWIGVFAAIGITTLLLTRADTPSEIAASTVNPNPTIKGTDGWNFAPVPEIAKYDASVSRVSDGSGSIRFEGYGSGGQNQTEQVVQVEKNTLYTITAWVKQDSWPPGSIAFLIRDLDYSINQYSARELQPTKVGQWVEQSFLFKSGNQTSVRLIMVRYNGKCPNPEYDMLPTGDQELMNKKLVAWKCGGQAPEAFSAKMWVDDVRMIKGARFSAAPSPKTPFDGSQTKIDALGNWQVKENGAWVDWFPMCGQFQQPFSYERYKRLKDQGFNCEGWTNVPDEPRLKNAKDAGMRTMIAFSPYVNPGFNVSGYGTFNNAEMLKRNITYINNSPYADNIAGYYWDNENSAPFYKVWADMTDTLKAFDRDPATGKRRRPIFQLSGSYGGTTVNKDGQQMSDSLGAYTGAGNSGGVASGGDGQFLLSKSPGQTLPDVMCALSGGIDKFFRAGFYRCLASGSKSMTYWGDGAAAIDGYTDSKRIEQMAFWSDLPKISSELKTLMDAKIIQATHYTNWTATFDNTQNNVLPIILGTRQHTDGTGYLIISNGDSTAYTKTITLGNMPYQVGAVQDVITGQTIANASGNKFTMTVSPGVTGPASSAASVSGGTYVLRLVKSGTSVTQCPTGYTGTYPNCVAPQCPAGQTGTPPNCVTPPTTTPQAPYTTAFSIPGTITLANYDKGGEGVSYRDTTTSNTGSGATTPPRSSEAVDINTIAGGSDSGTAVGQVYAGEWLEYTVNVATAGQYTPSLRAANASAGGVAKLQLADGTPADLATFAIPNTGAWNSFVAVTAPAINLTAGQHVLRLYMNTEAAAGGVGDFRSLTLTPAGDTPTTKKCDPNQDTKVDTNDLFILLANFNNTVTANTKGDCNNSGTVDTNDLFILLAGYGK